LRGEEEIGKIEDRKSHYVKQRRFLDSKNFSFRIDVKNKDHKFINKIESKSGEWRKGIKYSRGVEIAKSGDRLKCDSCGYTVPVPRKESSRKCGKCNNELSLEDNSISIVRNFRPSETSEEWKPLLVGEDVDRYDCSPSRWLKLGEQGVQYKQEHLYAKKKLLVRKTGVGIKSCIDDTGAYTLQVVHQFTPAADNIPSFYLDYVQGVMASRTICAYDLKRRGENEWRSHPYVTKRQLVSLPIPNIRPGSDRWSLAQEIASLVKRRRSQTHGDGTAYDEIDLMIERKVTSLFELRKPGCEWVVSILEDAQGLEPIRTLRVEDYESIMSYN
jgi:hypothetical protein